MDATSTSHQNRSEIVTIGGRFFCLPGDDIDTDQIIPSRYLRGTTFDGLERHVFEDARKASAAAGQVHPMSEPGAPGAAIMLVGRNFGCGSSREHAAQGLRRFGLRALVGMSFGEIFAGNCAAIGLPCLQVDQDTAGNLAALNGLNPELTIEIDLAQLELRAGGKTFTFDMPEGQRLRFVNGSWDALRQLLDASADTDRLASELPAVRANARGS